MSGNTAASAAAGQLGAARAAERSAFDAEDRRRLEALESNRTGRVLDPTLASLARELAQDIHPAEVVLRSHGFEAGLADPRWHTLAARPEWQRLLSEQITEWSKADSTKKRIALKSQAALESAIPTVYAISQDTNAKETDRLKAVELLGRFGGVGNEQAAGGGGGGFSLNITLATGKKIAVIDQQGVTLDSVPATESLDVKVGA